ncbi:beta-lactamase domain protein [Pseudomonas sp. St29]|nr:beta-lactamase domain protein [Pseudomonas sp. St29]
MSGHARLGYEILQAQKHAGSALLINLLSFGLGAAILFTFYDCAMKEIGWAWLASQLLTVIIVDIRNCILLSSPLGKSVTALLPWLGVIIIITTTSIYDIEGIATSLLLLTVFMNTLIFLAKRMRTPRQKKCPN